MKDACLRQDLLFIIIHQFYSLWALNPEEALGLVSVPRSLVDSGFQQLRSYIPESSKLHDVAKEFFAKIPLDLKEYLRASGRYQAQGSQALSMLVALSRAKNVSSVLEARKYPFLVDELLIHFRMPSMTLQELFFDQSVKTLGFSRTVHMGLITKMKDLFSADQRQHLGQKGFMEPSGYLSAEQLAVKNKDLILRYRHIYEKLQTWKPSPAPQLQPAPYSHFSQPSQQTQDQAVRQPELGMSTPQLQQHQAYQPQNQQTPNYQAVFDQGGTIRNVIGQAGEATAIAQGTNPPTDLRQGLHGDIHQRRSSNPALVPSALPLLNQMPQPSPTVLSPDSPSALQVTDGYLLQGRPINVPSARFDLRPQQMQPAPPPGMPVGVGLTSSAMAAPAQSTAAMVTPVQSPTSLGPAFGMLVPPHRQPQQNVLDANAASYLSGTTGVSGPQNLGAIFATSSAAPPMATTFAPTTAPQGQMHTPVVGQTSASMQQMQQTRQQHHMSPTPQQMQQFPQMHQVPLMPAYTGPGVARPLQSTTLIQGQGSGIQHQGMLGAQNTGAEQYQTAPRQYQNVPGHALQSPVEFSNAPAAQRPIQFVMSELNLANAQRLLNQAAQVRRGPGRPRANPATAATAQRPTSTAAQRPPQTNIQRTAASRPAPNLDRPLIPAAGQRIILQDYALDPYDRKGLMSGLHEAHLRSPERVCAQGIADTTEKRHYQSVRGFAVGPVAIPPQHAIYSLTFNVSPEQFARLSTTSVRGQFCPVRMAHYSSGSLRYRLKCCLGWPGGAVPTESEWVVSEMNWPEHIFMSIRGASDPTSKRVALQPRRKPHNSKDMPVELTTLVQPGGNIVELAVSGNGPKGDRRFFVAIEIVETLSHADALDTVMKTPPFAKAEMLKAIQDRTAASRMGGDDIAVVDEEAISIDLADPFTMKLYDIPVRGRTCTHLECFDLITWLTTRPTKPVSKACEHSGVCSCPPPAAEEPSLVDKWRCPHCLKDARPYNLQVDEFLSKVREELERTGDTKTRAILVRADGSWRSKSDDSGDAEDSGTDDDPLPPTRRKRSSTAPESTDGQNRKRRSVAAPTARPAPEVIELD